VWFSRRELFHWETLRVQINGEAHEVADTLKLSELVNELSLAPERVAIELNQQVVRRTQWPTTILADGDRIEIVHFVGGGTAVGSKPAAEGRNPCVFERFLVSVQSGVESS
jgi:sulfur carrier protein